MRRKLIALILFILCGAFLLPSGLWALTSNKDITVDDDSGDSPQIIMRDQDEKTLILQKLDTGEGNISNSDGAINIQPSTDTVHYLSLSTTSNLTSIYWKGHYTNDPAIRINSTGELEYRDQNEATWTTLDSLAGGGSGGAPTDATYITQTANSSLSGEQALGSLASGILRNATTTGILSIATAGTDYYNPGGTDVAVADGGTGTGTGSITGTTALTFTAGGTNQDINLRPSGTGNINFNNTTNSRTSFVNQWGDLFIDNAAALYTNKIELLEGGASPVRYTIFQGGDQTTDITYTLPTADGTASGQVLRTNGSGVLSWTATAPVDAKYITQTADSTLSGEQALGSLATGILKNTTTTGILSIATAGTDYYNPGGTDVAVADGGTGTGTGSITGTTALTFIAGGTNQDINLRPSGTGNINFNNTTNSRTAYVNQWGDVYTDAAGALYTNAINAITTANDLLIDTKGAGDIALQSNGSSTGKVGIGTATPNDKLDVQGGSIRNSALAGAAGPVYADASGTLNLSASDARLKKDITPIIDQLNVLESLSQLRGVYFHWNTKVDRVKNHGNQQEIGMIAQEVEKVLPEVVGVDNQGYRTLDYAKVTAYIIEVCKAQQAEIEALKKQIEALKK